MKVDIVIGLGWGDEGKGNVTNALATPESLIINFNGGNQRGHTVHHGDLKHVFASFGSGTFKGAATYWSKDCVIDPFALETEETILNSHGIKPTLYLDAEVMISTPWDVAFNKTPKYLQNGTVGVGVGATIERNENHYKLYARDLEYSSIFWYKIEMIRKYYEKRLTPEQVELIDSEWFVPWSDSCNKLTKNHSIITDIYEIPYERRKHIICEGAQGVMLDMDCGFFPHVTRSNTTSKNVFPILKELPTEIVTTWYVTRAYQTRHGAGPMTGDDLNCGHILPNEHETNNDKGLQGKFRVATLDENTLDYAVKCDKHHNYGNKFNLVVTCMDHSLINGKIALIDFFGELVYKTPEQLADDLELGKAISSFSPELLINNK